jgi:hypothetical protein
VPLVGVPECALGTFITTCRIPVVWYLYHTFRRYVPAIVFSPKNLGSSTLVATTMVVV